MIAAFLKTVARTLDLAVEKRMSHRSRHLLGSAIALSHAAAPIMMMTQKQSCQTSERYITVTRRIVLNQVSQ
ncbi:hypothetical protein CP98_05336 [Sphingobium yanoikuyae]|uniref:Uncharacterized protein n=1 Tax=Sphingobium yanoikuyae TaxID=13690 RepID=A0A084E1V9_SPHYA|nr:hypothetical protein [Sphingobium yanoikuyae]KEZ11951.1 hypothetical protein CP98_05336 [Sphingobium yanoikuyae]